MATTAELEYLIKVNDRDLKELKGRIGETNQALGETEGASRKSSEALRKIGKAANVTALAVGAGLATAAKIGFGEFMEGEKIAAQTEAVLKSTGGAAKVTAKEVEALAGALSKKSGVDDEAIQQGQNLLLTFTGIRNEAGKGNDIFNQATQTMLDMSVAMGTDAKSQAIQLGKALNDPTKGISALTRVGVTFTEAQKKQIKTMQEAGDTAGAQKVILAELAKEFGGSAAAAGKTFEGQMNILKNTLEGMAGDLIGLVIPYVRQFASTLQGATQWLSEHQGVAKVIVGVLGGFVAVVAAVNIGLKLYAVGQALATAATWAWNAALAANPIGLVVIALVALGAALFIAWKKSEKFREIVSRAWDGVKDAAERVGRFFTHDVPQFFQRVLDWVRGHWPEIATLILLPFTGPGAIILALATDAFGVKSRLIDAFNWIIETATSWGTKIKDGVIDGITGIGNAAWNLINNIGEIVQNSIEIVKGWGRSVGSWVKQAVVDALVGIGNAAWDIIDNIGERVVAGMKTILGWGEKIGNWVKEAVPKALIGIGSAAWDVINNIWEFVSERIERVKGWGKSIGSWIKNAIVDAITGLGGAIWDKIKGAWGWVKSKIPGLGGGGDGGNITPGPPLVRNGEVSPKLWDELGVARGMGLWLMSGYRAGAITSTGNPSDHGKWPSHAIDIASGSNSGWNDSKMRNFFLALVGRPGIKQLILSPYFWQPGMPISRINTASVLRDHWNHVHAAVFHRGGTVPGSRSQEVPAILRGGEFVFTPEQMRALGGVAEVHTHVYLDGREIAHDVRRELLREKGRVTSLGF